MRIHMAFIVGKKIGMSQIFAESGVVTPITLIKTESLTAVQVKTKEKDGYEAVQFSFGSVKHPRRKEFSFGGQAGDVVDVSSFKPGDVVKVSGTAKAKGFQGAVKRHGFAGMPASHGHHHVMRHVGSIGQRFPQHTLKGTRMAGRTGGGRVTTRGLTVVSVDAEKNMLAVKGAVPGRKGTMLTIVSM